MKKRQIQLIIILLIVTQLGLTGLQGKWLYDHYQEEKNNFKAQLNKAMDALFRAVDPGDVLHNKILEIGSENTSAAFINQTVRQLEAKLKTELIRQEIDTLFSFQLYQSPASGSYLNRRISDRRELLRSGSALPVYSNMEKGQKADFWITDLCPSCHLLMGIDFKAIQPAYFLGRMLSWIVLTIVLTGIQIAIFVYIVWGIFRQKKLAALKDTFINHMTHELNTPLFSLSLAIKHLKQFKLNGQAGEYLNIIEEEQNRLKSNVQRVLDITRMEAGNMEVQKDFFDLHLLLERIRKLFFLNLGGENIEIFMDLRASTPWIEADGQLIFNALYNLLDNAVKYSSANPIRIDILTRDEPKGWIKISVRDYGLGISRSEQPKVFDKFFRSQDHQNQVKGSGLGLSYVQMVAKAHQGRVQLDSQKGTGSTFSIFLPQKQIPVHE